MEFATGVLCDHWKRKEEKTTVHHFQLGVLCSEDSTGSFGSVTSSNLCDDASSSFSFSSSTSSLTKKGLSKFYQGKSRTFTSLLDVKCIEDLAKGEKNNYRKVKDSKKSLSANAIITKKVGRSSFASLVCKADS